MSSGCWRGPLQMILRKSDRIAIVGIGRTDAGDDAAGVLIVRALMAAILPLNNILLLDAGIAPENCTGALRQHQPDTILLIDAVAMDAEPGTVALLDWTQTTGLSASTHTLPLALVAHFLASELNCDCRLLGLQVESCGQDLPLSQPMATSARLVVDHIITVLAADKAYFSERTVLKW